ncbi:STAS domain-containing protein [Streptomyces sp. R08]|uniref:STAS domain-containing protein n=1 Tax=Streptomyces sp. R08 TaxID=3238624 RepID=A0AB39MN11_9ACTN
MTSTWSAPPTYGREAIKAAASAHDRVEVDCAGLTFCDCTGLSALLAAARPPATGHRPPATGHRPPATGHRPPATGHRQRTAADLRGKRLCHQQNGPSRADRFQVGQRTVEDHDVRRAYWHQDATTRANQRREWNRF